MEKIAKILDNYKPIDMVRASLWIFNDWDSDIEESIEMLAEFFLLSKKCEVKNLGKYTLL